MRQQEMTGGSESEEVSMDDILSKLVDITEWKTKVVTMIGVTGLIGITGGIDTSIPKSVVVESEAPIDKDMTVMEASTIILTLGLLK